VMHATLYCGDALEVLRRLSGGSCRICVTSPPYWRQRDYGVPGQLGLEATPEEYVARLVAIFAEVRRVLRDDGTLWLNLGDGWSGAGKGGNPGNSPHVKQRTNRGSLVMRGRRRSPFKDKDLIGVPWMTAFALRADGWYLRQCNIWAKPNRMPESVTDRSTISHEYVFHLSKSNNYFYAAEAARTPAAPSSDTRLAQHVEGQLGSVRAHGGRKSNGPMKAVRREKQRGHSRRHDGFNGRWDAMEQVAAGANLSSVWWISPAQYREAHFAVMPSLLAEICILAGSEAGDVVLDPFGGSGTVAQVATGHGRDAIYVDLNPAYLALAEQRIGPMLCDRAGTAAGARDG